MVSCAFGGLGGRGQSMVSCALGGLAGRGGVNSHPDIRALLDDADRLDAARTELGGGEQRAEAAADDQHLDLVAQRRAVRLDVV